MVEIDRPDQLNSVSAGRCLILLSSILLYSFKVYTSFCYSENITAKSQLLKKGQKVRIRTFLGHVFARVCATKFTYHIVNSTARLTTLTFFPVIVSYFCTCFLRVTTIPDFVQVRTRRSFQCYEGSFLWLQ